MLVGGGEGAGGALQVTPEITSVCEAGQGGKAEVRAQRTLQAGEVVHRVTRGVVPVAGTFGPAAVGRVRSHGERDGGDRLLHDVLGAAGVLIRDGERSERDAAVADLVPVVDGHTPPVVPLVDLDGFVEPF